MLNRLRLVAALLAASLSTPAFAAGDTADTADTGATWHPDLGPALEIAREQGKDLLVDFTGSDWCSWCHKLDGEVFSQELFAEYAAENFVLVELDFPRKGGEVWEAMPADLRERNNELQAQFGVQGFPTVLLLTPEGVAYAKTGYRPDGAGPYIQHLTELREGDERTGLQQTFERFRGDPDNAEGRRLAAAYELLGKVGGDLHEQVLATIAEHDPEDSRGVLARLALEEWKARFLVGKEPDWQGMLAAGDELLEARPSLDGLAEFHAWRGFAHGLSDDLEAAEAELARAEALDGGGDPRLGQMIRNLAGLIAAKQAEGGPMGGGEPSGG